MEGFIYRGKTAGGCPSMGAIATGNLNLFGIEVDRGRLRGTDDCVA
jgi:hypothetical protein